MLCYLQYFNFIWYFILSAKVQHIITDVFFIYLLLCISKKKLYMHRRNYKLASWVDTNNNIFFFPLNPDWHRRKHPQSWWEFLCFNRRVHKLYISYFQKLPLTKPQVFYFFEKDQCLTVETLVSEFFTV